MTETLDPDQPSTTRPPRRTPGVGPALGWAAFLACSWTWCIGMYLPVLLVRDYGLWGWVIFAVPNVLGAAAMAWVLRDAAASRSVVENHRGACLLFSFVTVAFQWYFAGWMLDRPATLTMAAAAVALAVLLWTGTLARWTGVVVLLASLAAFAAFVFTGPAFTGLSAPPPRLYGPSPLDLLYVAPVCAFGFALCPYLDLTFHRARQSATPAGGRLVFGVGFGVLFLAMIVFTLAYAGVLAYQCIRCTGEMEPMAEPGRSLVAYHIALQLAFTVAAHLRDATAVARSPNLGFGAVALAAAAVGLLLSFVRYVPRVDYYLPSPAEALYLCFMGFYGLVFPAYVWLCMIPGRGRSRPTRRQVVVTVAAVLIALPMYWMGFIERREWWLAPGLLVVLLARLGGRGGVVTSGDHVLQRNLPTNRPR